MTTCHIYKVLVVLLSILSLQKGEDLNANSVENDNKFNVVLFLAKTTIGETYREDSGIKYLNFVEKKRVKHCAPQNNPENEVASTYTCPGSDCKQLLKSGMYSLISYCRNVMGMSTAIASVENDTFSNGLRFKKSTSEDFEIRYHYPRRLKSRSGILDPMKLKSHFITEPEHTEVFKIRSKRQNHLDEIPPDIPDRIDAADGSKWDVFGILANIKLTFFGKLLENGDLSKVVPEGPHKELIDQLGKVSENCLFELVKETLQNLQENQECGFLMIILGGSLEEICNVYSSLMQSVKHVIENTDDKNTLIVVTGLCPLIDKPTPDEEEFLIPVYVRGPPKTSSLVISGQLYDVPYSIKNLLAEMGGGTFYSGKGNKRKIRSTFESKSLQNKTAATTSLLFLVILPSIFPLIM